MAETINYKKTVYSKMFLFLFKNVEIKYKKSTRRYAKIPICPEMKQADDNRPKRLWWQHHTSFPVFLIKMYKKICSPNLLLL